MPFAYALASLLLRDFYDWGLSDFLFAISRKPDHDNSQRVSRRGKSTLFVPNKYRRRVIPVSKYVSQTHRNNRRVSVQAVAILGHGAIGRGSNPTADVHGGENSWWPLKNRYDKGAIC